MPGERDALLVATGSYDNSTLRALRSPVHDSAGLAAVLGDPRIGAFRVEQVLDAPSYQVTRAVERFFRDRGRDDLLLLHLSCHGIKDDDGQLYFAARDTDKDLPASTAVAAGFLRAQMDRCRARSIVVLLDCCYSGAFLAGSKGDDHVHVRDELVGHGRAVLTATSRTEYAWEGRHLDALAPQPSRFTGALIEGLRTGAADTNHDGRISITDLYDYVYDAVRRSGARQTPRLWADLEYQIVIARTPKPGTAETPSAETETPSAETGARESRPRARRGQDALIRLEISLREAAFGATRDILVDTALVCSACSGEGMAPGASVTTCDRCHGSGQVAQAFGGRLAQALRGQDDGPGSRPCRHCQGFGTVISTPCPACSGEGRVRAGRTLTLKIPPGIESGSRIHLAGEGEVGPGGGPAGDVYVEVVVKPHNRFTRQGDDLYCQERVLPTLAATGGTIQVETLDGVQTVRLPAGLRSGSLVTVPGAGVPHLRVPGRGDLLIRMYVEPFDR